MYWLWTLLIIPVGTATRGVKDHTGKTTRGSVPLWTMHRNPTEVQRFVYLRLTAYVYYGGRWGQALAYCPESAQNGSHP